MTTHTLPADRSSEDLAELLLHLTQLENWLLPIAREGGTIPGDADDDVYRARMALRAYARDNEMLSETARRLADRVEAMQVSCDVLADVGALCIDTERERSLLAETARRLAEDVRLSPAQHAAAAEDEWQDDRDLSDEPTLDLGETKRTRNAVQEGR